MVLVRVGNSMLVVVRVGNSMMAVERADNSMLELTGNMLDVARSNWLVHNIYHLQVY